ncbi:MAG: EutN/CcmL family microcompartment protein [Deltaproteobacteria bacterium]|nr:EutN/CcmL family microcompartment protein [Deltaproteobacteria bacterium]
MLLAKVTGTLVATRKEPTLEGLKLLVVRPCDVKGNPSGAALIAADAVGAGLGEVVLLAAGSSARQTEATKERPVDSVIMAIVDLLEVDGETTFEKVPVTVPP